VLPTDSELTTDRVRECLDYNPDTGIMTWKVQLSRNTVVGEEAGCLNPDGYRRVSIDKRGYLIHRLAWLHVHGAWPAGEIDHINGVPHDNRIENLRTVSHQENSKNQKMPSTNTTGVVGVYWDKRSEKWHAQIQVDGKKLHLGYSESLEEAVLARRQAEREYGFHSNHGRTAGKELNNVIN